jgi:hypothetical protein
MLATRMGDLVIETCNKGPSGPFIQGSLNTFTNNRPQVRMGDKSLPGISIGGSRKRFTNNKPTTRIIDPVVCGQIVQGSLNTFIF